MTRSATGSAAAAVAALVLLATACGRQVPREGPDRVSPSRTVHGCWSLQVTAEGASLDSLRGWLPSGSLPTVLRLDTVRVPEAPGKGELFRARSYFDGRRQDGPFSAWRWTGPDSVLVERPRAMAGVTLRLGRADGHLEGSVAVFTDAMEPGRPSRMTGPVRAEPASCPDDGASETG